MKFAGHPLLGAGKGVKLAGFGEESKEPIWEAAHRIMKPQEFDGKKPKELFPAQTEAVYKLTGYGCGNSRHFAILNQRMF